VVDAHGCVSGQLVELCHVPPGNPDKRHTIRVAVSAVAAHLAHGDYLGACGARDGEDEDGSRGGKKGRRGADDGSDGDPRGQAQTRDKPAAATGREEELLRTLEAGECGAGALALLPLTVGGLLTVKRRAHLARRTAPGERSS
jgi:hypothetical protein